MKVTVFILAVATVIAIILVAGCAAPRHDDNPRIPRDVLCSMITCGKDQ